LEVANAIVNVKLLAAIEPSNANLLHHKYKKKIEEKNVE
jgi:hypothetical protein